MLIGTDRLCVTQHPSSARKREGFNGRKKENLENRVEREWMRKRKQEERNNREKDKQEK